MIRRCRRRSRCLPDPARDQLICRDYLAGLKTVEIAHQHGVSESFISVIIKRAGIPCRRPKIHRNAVYFNASTLSSSRSKRRHPVLRCYK